MDYLNAFLCGGILCAIGQILIDKTPLTPARILTGYVVCGVLLTAIGVMTGGLSATAGGIAAAIVFAVLMALIFKPGDKR